MLHPTDDGGGREVGGHCARRHFRAAHGPPPSMALILKASLARQARAIEKQLIHTHSQLLDSRSYLIEIYIVVRARKGS